MAPASLFIPLSLTNISSMCSFKLRIRCLVWRLSLELRVRLEHRNARGAERCITVYPTGSFSTASGGLYAEKINKRKSVISEGNCLAGLLACYG